MARNSNDTGRAFEYLITKKLIELLKEKGLRYALTKRAKNSSSKDAKYLEELSNALKNSLNSGANSFTQWINRTGWFREGVNVLLDRMSDGAGVQGDPTDIQITINDTDVKRISIKHHHNALKHPRLPRLPDQCGISNNKLKKEYNEKMDEVWKQFSLKAKKLSPNTTAFSGLKELDSNFINDKLYKPLIKIVCSFLESNANNPENASKFFSFLTGNFDFYTIKNEEEQILIKHFNNLKKPKGFKIKYPYHSDTTFLLSFDNGWDLTFRLHTATTNYIKNGKLNQSTKFDVVCINLEKMIKIESIRK